MSQPANIETNRLILRRWRDDDARAWAALNSDAEVIAWLGRRAPMTLADARDDIGRFDAHFDAYGFGPWAVETRADGALIGLCGLRRVLEGGHPMAPCVEIAWRQARLAWGRGYMTEAARAALADAFGDHRLAEAFAWAAATNLRSQRVMTWIGMQRAASRDFDHPALPEGHSLRRHVVYCIRRETSHA
ncbi:MULTISPECIES: GNAT family N-acetyltransferase [Burkholderia]|uniref:GNAT family N-acetyltransferase n=1 Tax=Burkholderia TaxID=32008 RepID=UPI000757BBE3|nr:MULTISPECIES: GNAT family N-acetyltransferase [Burkholderia]AOJ73285.1 GCN5 family acetyltransferase [Burkholderia savannae]KVG45177.1 GCN5 family acetyltransferase [Burkholderia sp. MSMB0265]KVG90137.1 GCN5 family acetyltransferase [Burkholderia sp. MSMB2040]KVG96303.1 GCN5 family acetyltransferase [Burkholderia sp. MSMB2041]KVG99915.1 GCN5 family acetyltransferase [Burkholderia sp. MSMB2042]